MGMSANKTPGIDGLPKEFYVAFWETVGEDLLYILNYSFSNGAMSHSQRHGVISLIHKKGERDLCKNYRPISLLCVDYKIASRAISARLRTVISSLVSDDQPYCIPGRFIGENIRLLQDAILYAQETDQPLALLSFDQEKAFDRVDWSYLLRVLSKMGFGPHFYYPTHLLPDFYCSVLTAWAMIDGHRSEDLGLCFLTEEEVLTPAKICTAKGLHQCLVAVKGSTPYCIEKFTPSFCPLYWPDTWVQIYSLPLDRRAQTLLFRFTPLSPSIRLGHMLFGYDENEREIVPPVFFYLLCLIKDFVWLARNEARFDDVAPDVSRVKARVIARLNSHLACFSKRFASNRRRRFFDRSWNVLGNSHSQPLIPGQF